MSGWGIKDDKTSTGTIALSTAGAVTGTSTAFTTEAKVGDILTTNSIDFRITAIASNTACTVVDADTAGAAIANISAGESYTLSEKPSGMIAANSVGGFTSETVFGVDQTEMGVTNGPAHAGWVRVQTSAGGRKRYETLVALSSGSSAAADMGDAEETEFPDS
jgi:hypothetical protein